MLFYIKTMAKKIDPQNARATHQGKIDVEARFIIAIAFVNGLHGDNPGSSLAREAIS